jgi:hypothetical protein
VSVRFDPPVDGLKAPETSSYRSHRCGFPSLKQCDGIPLSTKQLSVVPHQLSEDHAPGTDSNCKSAHSYRKPKGPHAANTVRRTSKVDAVIIVKISTSIQSRLNSCQTRSSPVIGSTKFTVISSVSGLNAGHTSSRIERCGSKEESVFPSHKHFHVNRRKTQFGRELVRVTL